jgi:transcriptional regulator with XRE-family HTH domain
MSKLGELLKRLRGDSSLFEVEKATKVSRAQIMRYEKGLLPEAGTLKKLAEYFEIPYVELRKIYYVDYFNQNPDEREAALAWAQEYR